MQKGGDIVSAKVLALSQEALKNMILTKVKLCATTLLCAGLLLPAIGGALPPAASAQDVKSPALKATEATANLASGGNNPSASPAAYQQKDKDGTANKL